MIGCDDEFAGKQMSIAKNKRQRNIVHIAVKLMNKPHDRKAVEAAIGDL